MNFDMNTAENFDNNSGFAFIAAIVVVVIGILVSYFMDNGVFLRQQAKTLRQLIASFRK